MRNEFRTPIMAEYAFKDIRVRLLGRDIVGLQGITYKKTVEKEFLYGRGSKPLGIQTGNQKVEGTLSIFQSEFEALQAAVGDITTVQFDVVNTYGDGDKAKTDMILSVSVTEYEKGMKQNDKMKVIDLPFLALDVLEGV
jgi:hypothetical protein